MKRRKHFKWKKVGGAGRLDWLGAGGLYRLKVPGGWLVRYHDSGFAALFPSDAMTFVPDPEYEWNLQDSRE